MLKAGYMEDWIHHKIYSGTPQGGIVSPLLSNIVLNELDKFVEDTLIPKYTKGKARKRNPEYMRLMLRAEAARKKGNYKLNGELQKVCRTMPSQLSNDPDFRRLRYIRYAINVPWCCHAACLIMGRDGSLACAITRRQATFSRRQTGALLQRSSQ